MVNKLNKKLKENYYNNRLNRQYEPQNTDDLNIYSDCNSGEKVYQNLDIEGLQCKGTTFDKKCGIQLRIFPIKINKHPQGVLSLITKKLHL